MAFKCVTKVIMIQISSENALSNYFLTMSNIKKAEKLTPSKKPIFGEGSRRPEGFAGAGGLTAATEAVLTL